jgi:hypothetical protein
MGRFGALDGLIMLGLQLACVLGALCLASRTVYPAGAPAPKRFGWIRLLLAGLLSFVIAFIAHIIALNLLKHGWPDGFANPWIKRPLVALAWGSATALGIRMGLRPAPPRSALLLTACAGALAYIIFALWRA